MNALKPITIVGGGLAGLTLAIGLRQNQVPVCVYEATHYPRHRVCGEFISGRGQEVLQRMGLLEKLVARGAQWARSAQFFSRKELLLDQPLPESALCLSRFTLDALLADELVRSGGELQTHSRWTENFVEGVVKANGRRIQASENGRRCFGLKIHATNVPMTADLELHFTSNGYVGLCRLSKTEVNLCGLFHSQRPVPDLARKWQTWISGERHSPLGKRLCSAKFDMESFSAVAGISLKPLSANQHPECVIGDALTMIPPFTGNGMSMAFESAEAAITPLVAYSRGEKTWLQSKTELSRKCDALFRRRLFCARLLQSLLHQTQLRDALHRFANRNPRLWAHFFRLTR